MSTILKDSEIIELGGQRKGTKRYLIRNFVYHVKKDRLKETYYCAARDHQSLKCNVKIVRKKHLEIVGTHTDTAQPHLLEEIEIIKELRKMAITSFEEPQNLFDELSARYEESEAMINISFVRAENIIIRAREIIPIPRKFEELADAIKNHSKLKELFRAHIVETREEQEAIILIQKNMIQELNEATVLQVDGVFKIVPSKPNLTQLWILHTSKKGDIETLPAVFVLTRGAKGTLYRLILKQLIAIAPGLKDHAITLITDFEQAVINAFQAELPNARIQGCWFHFCQAVIKYWDKLGLQNAPKEALYLTQKLALAPFQFFERGLQIVEEVIQKHLIQWPNMSMFLEYLRKQWGNKGAILSNFGSQIRTNNKAEAFNRHLVQRFGGKNPGFFKFLHKLNVIIRSEALNLKRCKKGISIHKEKKNEEKHEKHMKILRAQEELMIGGDLSDFMYEVMDEAVQDCIIIEGLKRGDTETSGIVEIDMHEIEKQRLIKEIPTESDETEYGVKTKRKRK